MASERIVAVTCMGVRHPLLSQSHFDVCLVDEASQLTQPTVVGALLRCKRFVLVGDHFQLPPVVRDEEAREAGLDESLFRRLSQHHPHAVAQLTMQYRMNSDIVKVANELVYNGMLKCGTKAVGE